MDVRPRHEKTEEAIGPDLAKHAATEEKLRRRRVEDDAAPSSPRHEPTGQGCSCWGKKPPRKIWMGKTNRIGVPAEVQNSNVQSERAMFEWSTSTSEWITIER
jgi:hypothetical protein